MAFIFALLGLLSPAYVIYRVVQVNIVKLFFLIRKANDVVNKRT